MEEYRKNNIKKTGVTLLTRKSCHPKISKF